MSDAIRAFRMFDVEARSIDPTKLRTRPVNGCWPAAPPAPARPPAPPARGRIRCH